MLVAFSLNIELDGTAAANSDLPSLDKSKSCSFTVLQQPSNRSRGSEKHAPISDIIYEVE